MLAAQAWITEFDPYNTLKRQVWYMVCAYNASAGEAEKNIFPGVPGAHWPVNQPNLLS